MKEHTLKDRTDKTSIIFIGAFVASVGVLAVLIYEIIDLVRLGVF